MQDFKKCNGTTDSAFAGPDDEVDNVVMRKRVKKRRNTTRMSVINGHLYDAEVMQFTVRWFLSLPLQLWLHVK